VSSFGILQYDLGPKHIMSLLQLTHPISSCKCFPVGPYRISACVVYWIGLIIFT